MGMITEVMMGVVSGLTPAQVGFLEVSIDNFKLVDWKVELAGQAASTRRFFRISRHGKPEPAQESAPKSYILIEWDSKDEDWPRFLGIAGCVSSSSIDVLPKIYAADPVHGLILEEDLGAVTLRQFCQGRAVSLIEDMYRRVIDAMRAWHRLDISSCQYIASRAMDVETFIWESGYFARHCVTEFFGKEGLLTAEWEKERKEMAERAAGIPRINMHRDFQSENILIHDGRIRLVDFQGARLGPAHYDAASLLFDPYITELGVDCIDGLIDYYLAKESSSPSNKKQAAEDGHPGGISEQSTEKNSFYVCAAQRLMQALGAYANLSLHKSKPQYRQYIPTALDRLSCIFNKYLPDYPAMRGVVTEMLL